MTRRKVMITIQSSCLQISNPALDEAEDEEELDSGEIFADDLHGEMPEPTELLVEGMLVTNQNRVELMYEESEMSGMMGSVTTIGFDRSAPGLVSMMRTGTVQSAFVFEQKKRHTSVYDTPFTSFELCVHTLCVENKLLTEGTIHLDYLVEFHGAEAEHCKITISARPLESVLAFEN